MKKSEDLLMNIVAYGYSLGLLGILVFSAIAGLFLFPVEPVWRYGVVGLCVSVCIFSASVICGIRKGYLEKRPLSDIKLFFKDWRW